MPRLLRLRSAWGLPNLASGDRRRIFSKLRESGWDGVEASLADIGATVAARRECIDAARSESMNLVLSAYSSWHNYEGPFDASLSVQGHAAAFDSELQQIAELHTAAPSPIIHVNAHSGSDHWGDAEAIDYFESAIGTAHALGDALPSVSHETHRGRYLCCPFATARLLHKVPSLRLTSDFSHWVVKCERLLDAPEEVTLLEEIIAPAVDHIHARIGTPQAPQVADVESSSVRAAAERHYAWWEAIWTAREKASISGRDATLTATIEYGPVELSDAGEYCGYTPVDVDLRPVAGVPHEETLLRARDGVEERFRAWHGERPWRRGWW